MDYEKAKSNYLDIEELACKITGLDYDEIDADTGIIEDKLDDEFGIDLPIFQDIVNRLLPLIDVGKSPLTNETFKGFSDQKGCWYVKFKIEK